MKKTLMITFEFPPMVGGIATYIETMVSFFPSEKLVVLAPPHPQAKEWDSRQPYTIVRRPFLYPRLMWPRWLRLFFQVWRIVKQEKIERIMIHHALPAGYVGLLIKKFRGIPSTLFFHGTDVMLASRSAWKRRMMTLVAGEAECLVFNSEWLRNRFVQVYPQMERKTLRISPCPESIFFETPSPEAVAALRERYALGGKKVILSVGRLVEGKGYPHLLRLLPQILLVMSNVVWLVVGDGPKRAGLVARVQKLYLQNVVRFAGEFPRHDLPALYALADVFVLLTHPDDGREESFGLVFLEAAAMGIPVVAGRSGGVGEAVVNKETGLIVDVHQEKQVVAAIVSILTDSAYGRAMGQRARVRAQEFRWEKHIEKFL